MLAGPEVVPGAGGRMPPWLPPPIRLQGLLGLPTTSSCRAARARLGSQKKDFDTVQTNIASAKNAEDSAIIATRAAPLISQAYGGKIESGIKGLAGAVGISTTAKEANDQLTQLSQQLALKTPKFSGPTSDADAKRYDKAVGDLANPSVTPASKVIALKNITELSRKASDYAKQQENYYFANNKSLRGFVYTESNPFGQ